MSGGLALRARQALAVLRLEIRKSFLSKRAIPVYLLASMPVIVLALRALVHGAVRNPGDVAGGMQFFADFYQTFVLRFIIFFGCLFAFSTLFRGEILDKTLHYYLLAPVRRGVLVAGKYAAGLLVALVLLGGANLASLVLLYVPHDRGAVAAQLLERHGIAHAGSYLAVTALACLAYGAAFLVFGVFFRNPLIPGIVLLGWESIQFLLPVFLKRISLSYYLSSLCPLSVSEGPFAILGDPVPPWIAVLALLALAGVLLLAAAFRLRRMEVLYGAE